MQNMQGLLQWKCMSSNVSDTGREQQGNVVKPGQESRQDESQAEGILPYLFTLFLYFLSFPFLIPTKRKKICSSS